MSQNILSDKLPELVKEWDYEKNFPLKPEDVTIGSHKVVYWICPVCKLSYPAKICNRTALEKPCVRDPRSPSAVDPRKQV